MQEEFENTVRERMRTFGIQPSHQVWGEIEAVLNKKKHRRVFVGWWILLGLVVLGGGVLYYEKDSIGREGLNQQPIITADTAGNTHIAKNLVPATTETGAIIPPQNKRISANNDRQAHQSKTTVTDDAVAGRNNLTAQKVNPTGNSKTAFLAKTRMANIITSRAGASQTKAVTNTHADASTTAVAPTNETQTTHANNEIALAAIPTPAAQTNNDTTAGKAVVLRDSVVADRAATKLFKTTNVANKTAFAPQKEHTWYVTFSAGTTRTVSFGQFNGAPPGNTVLAANLAYTNVPAVTALNFFKYDITAPGTGFNIAFGGLYERELSARWKISGGLSFNYLSNTQRVGILYKSPFSVAAGGLNNLTAPQISLDAYYQPGRDALLVNKAWQAQLPINVGYVFNPKAKTKFLLNSGLSVAWLFNSQWLIPDTRYGKLYYSNAAFNNTTFNWQVGPAIQLPNQWKFGLQYQQSFGTVAKNYITPKLYWQHISIYTAIPLGGKRRH